LTLLRLTNRRPIEAAVVSGIGCERHFAARSGLVPSVSGMPETCEHGLLKSMQPIGRFSDDGPQSKCQGRSRQMQDHPASAAPDRHLSNDESARSTRG